MVKASRKKVDLSKVFLGLQRQMAVKLGTARVAVGHPVAKGDVTENSWRAMLGQYLPRRYAVEKAFVVDSEGNVSDQIDLVIFDRHFSPFLFHEEGAYYIPAESVYAAFEIKQELSKKEIEYAAKKIESVRKLKRTSTHITHAGGRHRPVKPKAIIGGMLCLGIDWGKSITNAPIAILKSLPPQQRLDLVCVLNHGAIAIRAGSRRETEFEVFPAGKALIQFFLSLLSKLQAMGSVPAMDIGAYKMTV